MYITFMPSCNFPLLLCCQEEADANLSSAPLLLPASRRGGLSTGEEGKKAKQNPNTTEQKKSPTKPGAVSRPAGAEGSESRLVLSYPGSTRAGGCAHLTGMRGDAPGCASPPGSPPSAAAPRASVLARGVVRRGVRGFRSSQQVAEVRSRPRPGVCHPAGCSAGGRSRGGCRSRRAAAAFPPATSVRQGVGAAVVNPVGPVGTVGPVVPVR